MSAYFIARIRVDDPAKYDEYSAAAIVAINDHGGELLVVDDHPDLIEGEWRGPRTVVLRFASKEAARDWYESSAYQAAIPLRHASAETSLILADGFE